MLQTRGLARGRVLNRPPPRPAPGGPVKSYRPPPPPSRARPLDKVPAPVIISSYASSVVQGGSKAEQQRIQDTFDKYEKLNEIPTEDVEEKIETEDEAEELPETVTEPIEEEVSAQTEEIKEQQVQEETIVDAVVEEVKEDTKQEEPQDNGNTIYLNYVFYD